MDLPRLRIDAPSGVSERRRIADYYVDTADDYTLWSRRRNMHFGFWRRGMSLCDREAMLEQMNREVVRRLRVEHRDDARVLDLGCGVGTAMRTVARMAPTSRPAGLTAVASQAIEGRAAANAEGETCPPIVVGDFTRSPFRDHSVDAVYAIESSCYAPGLDKAALLAEMARLVVPEGRMVVADAFLRRRTLSSPVTRAAHRAICDAWAVDTLGHLESFVATANEVGFTDVTVEDITPNVAPSAGHVVAVTARFLNRQLLGVGGPATATRWRNALVGPALALFAADPTAGGYYIVSATRRASAP